MINLKNEFLGQSDEFSFVFRRNSEIFNRRQNKISSLVVSMFTSAYVINWTNFFESSTNHSKNCKLLYPPCFDSRVVLYPSKKVIIDYLKWRQVDCHINNLYNTTFHALTGEYTKYLLTPDGNYVINQGIVLSNDSEIKTVHSATDATDKLSGTVSSDKQEILFQNFGINYNNELEQFKKGTLLILDPQSTERFQKILKDKKSARNIKANSNENFSNDILCLNIDIVGNNDKFWKENNYIFDF